MKGVQCKVVKKQPGAGDLVTLTERCRWPDGSQTASRCPERVRMEARGHGVRQVHVKRT